jgi:membrane-associated phospholipid phosphatase
VRKIVFAVMLSLVGAVLATPVSAQPVAPGSESIGEWNRLALNAVRLKRASDADAGRLYAMLNVAIYDSVNGIRGRAARAPALVPESGPGEADPQAAAVSAAHTVMVALDPDRTTLYDDTLAADLAGIRSGHHRDAGVAWGQHVGELVVAARADDGSTPVESQPAGSGPGKFPSAWSGVQYRNVRPFAVGDATRFVLGPPPALDSLDYAAGFAEVALLGNAAIAAPDKLATFQYWSLPAGSDQPPGEWVKVALTVAAVRHQSLNDAARLLALLTMAEADTTVATVGTKFAHQHWRPAQAIPGADLDGNPLTVADPTWRPRGGNAGSPEWISGHSSYSGAAATVLAGFFCTDAIGFDLVTDTAPGGTPRSYAGFSAAAAEAGRSRVFGGLHFEFSNQAGLRLGHDVAADVLAHSLLLTRGDTHFGACPR